MAQDQVLIVGQMPDPHMTALAEQVQRLGKNVILFDAPPSDPVSTYLTYRFEEGRAHSNLQVAGVNHDLRSVGAVFWRVKAPISGLATANPAFEDYDFRYKEWDRAIRGLGAATPSAHWINPVDAHWLASNKLYQLHAASKVGLAIPETVVTNDPEAAAHLFQGGDVIYKTLSHPFYSSAKMILTTMITKEEFDIASGQVPNAACLFQRYIDKSYELRVTVIGDTIMPVKVKSQDQQATRIDWRVDQLRASMYEEASLTAELCDQIIQFMKIMGLTYGALDFIVDKAGRHVFLECNPGGQWLWMEELIGVPITKGIAARICAVLDAVEDR